MRRLRVAWLPDGKKLHLRNGPLNLIIRAFGAPAEVGRAYNAGIERARVLVSELAEDLPRLQLGAEALTVLGRRAVAACAEVPGALAPVTALTGAVADEVLHAMTQAGQLDRAFVNNHGALAFHLAEGQSITPDEMDWPDYPRYDARVPIASTARSRGLAVGGWRFEGFALGCVDRIFTAATSSAIAEAALGSVAARMYPAGGARMVPADSLVPQSILGGLAVYPQPESLTGEKAVAILAQARAVVEALIAPGIITLAMVEVGDEHFLDGPPHLSLKSTLSLES
jgi:uncharacterized protein